MARLLPLLTNIRFTSKGRSVPANCANYSPGSRRNKADVVVAKKTVGYFSNGSTQARLAKGKIVESTLPPPISTSQTILDKNPGKWHNRLVIGTPATGLVRMEWVVGRYGQVIPTNWSHIEIMQ